MLDEQAPTLRIKDVDLTAYADSLIERFANPALQHRTWQIAMDGSQKLPQRMLDGIRVHLERNTVAAAGPGRGRLDTLRQRYRRPWQRD
jgi:mannitol-1-phosphate/altronate dehydrogenase